jgi:hypothetical protein
MSIHEAEQLTYNQTGTQNVPNQNAGNLRNAAGQLVYNYNPIIADASITYTLDSFPMYTGAFPIKVGGEFMHNPAAPRFNEAYNVGVTLGKSGKRGTWEASYKYKELQGDAWYEEVVDSDFGSFYRAPLAPATNFRTVGGTSASGYFAGTNVRGHVIKASYSPNDSLTLGITYFLTDTVDAPNRFDGGMQRLQVDAIWKF